MGALPVEVDVAEQIWSLNSRLSGRGRASEEGVRKLLQELTVKAVRKRGGPTGGPLTR